jgi:hypothetical protein
MSSEVTVEQQYAPTMTTVPTVVQQCIYNLVHGRIILKCILRKQGRRVLIGFICIKTETSDQLL